MLSVIYFRWCFYNVIPCVTNRNGFELRGVKGLLESFIIYDHLFVVVVLNTPGTSPLFWSTCNLVMLCVIGIPNKTCQKSHNNVPWRVKKKKQPPKNRVYTQEKVDHCSLAYCFPVMCHWYPSRCDTRAEKEAPTPPSPQRRTFTTAKACF